MAAMTSEERKNKAVVSELHDEVMNKGNYEYIDAALSPDFVDHPAARLVELPDRGRDAFYETAVALRGGFPDLHDQMLQAVAEGDRVMYLGRITGTHTGRLAQAEPSGRKLDKLAISGFRLEQGKIVERWAILDPFAIAAEIGAGPAVPDKH
jgi:predicted ester cyclase